MAPPAIGDLPQQSAIFRHEPTGHPQGKRMDATEDLSQSALPWQAWGSNLADSGAARVCNFQNALQTIWNVLWWIRERGLDWQGQPCTVLLASLSTVVPCSATDGYVTLGCWSMDFCPSPSRERELRVSLWSGVKYQSLIRVGPVILIVVHSTCSVAARSRR